MTIEFPTTIQISFHKFTLTLFLQVLKFLSFNGINYKKDLLTQPPRTKKGKLIIIKNSISTGRIILKQELGVIIRDLSLVKTPAEKQTSLRH